MYSRRQLEAVLHRERARADRNQCEFSLILFRARAEDRRLTLRLARLLNRRARTIDELGWFDDACVAVLLPYTSCDGARIFAESALKMAQEALIPTICRVYTYPNAWYFGDDRSHHTGNGANANGNGHPNRRVAASNGDGHSNGNGNGHAKLLHLASTPGQSAAERSAAPAPASDGDAHSHGHGHGNGHGNGNGNGNGNGKATNGGTTLLETPLRVTAATTPAAPRTQLEANDLVPYVMQGLSDGLRPPDAGADGVETLLVRRLPWWKRGIDIAGATVGLVAFSPFMIAAAIAIKGTSRGAVIFKQRRAGLGGQPFWIYKFRTMTTDAEARKAALRKLSEQDGPAFKLTNDPRVTPVGKFLRETSLDELPQLWNVLKGDMSLVGPRPLPMDESAECERWQRRRLDVTPGLTCIWQVKGRSRVTFAEWMRMDVNYICRRNLLHDVKILAETIPAVLFRRGAR